MVKPYREMEIFDSIPLENGRHIPIIYGPEHVQSEGFQLLYVTKVEVGNEQCHGIIVDDTYLSMSENIKIFFLLHEMGHILHGDVELPEEESKMILQSRMNGEVPEMELKADAFAIQYYPEDRLIDMLIELGKIISISIEKNPEDVAANEFLQRYNAMVSID